MLAALGIAIAFSVPLFVGLERTDLRNDEAIYSYAAERILDTGEWLTPRSIPSDGAFLEKPPLKFWMVAAARLAGIARPDESGMRLVDAVLATIAFMYVIAFAARTVGGGLAGVAAGVGALLTLLSFQPIVEAFRSNNMEAALTLAYCGGLYHLLRWWEAGTAGRGRGDAVCVALYFVLGFMTKFVAAAFLPVVGLAWLMQTPRGRQTLMVRSRDWIWPVAIAAAGILPWFVYQSIISPDFWQVILGTHVVTRLTSSLDPNHLAPWHHYFTGTWDALRAGGGLPIVVAGVASLLWRAARGDQASRLLVLWWLLPTAVISLGSSKLLHYAYPFIPALAIGAGVVPVMLAARLVSWIDHRVGVVPWLRSRRPNLIWWGVAGLGAAMVGIGLVTDMAGSPIRIGLGDLRLLSNSSAVRPIAAGIVLLVVAGQTRWAVRAVATFLLLVVLPAHAYVDRTREALAWKRPLGAARDCIAALQAARVVDRAGVFISDPLLVSHPPYYYFRHLGQWQTGPDNWQGLAQTHLLEKGGPVLLTPVQWTETLRALSASSDTTAWTAAQTSRAVAVEDLLLVLPGAHASCVEPVEAGGGTRLW